MRSVRPSRQRPSGKAAPGARACPFLPAEGLPIPARSHRFACGYDQGTTEQKIAEARFAQSMAEIKIVDRIDVSARIVDTSIANRKRAEEIEKTGHEVAQARTQIQDIGRGNNRDATGLEHAMDFVQ